MSKLSLRSAFGPALLALSLTAPARATSVESTRISLPKGPASIEGLGRNFVPSLASGTAAYGLDVAVPPGVAGFVPKLGLDYDSGGGVSELGMGWKLGGVPSIRRRTEHGLPRFDASDTFEVSGLGVSCDLLEVEPGVFRPEFETGSFVRVKQSADGATWEARVKNGFTYRFGGEGFTEQEDGHVATYLLRSQHDLHGHSINYAWDTSSGYALLSSVVYNHFSDDTRVEVAFTYESRPDEHVLFSSGIRRALTQRLKTVEVTLGGDLVRRYDLGYDDAGGHSRLGSVRMVGTDGETAMPTLSFGYTEASFAADGQIVKMTTAPGRSPSQPDSVLADVDGDSLPDLLVAQAGAYRSYSNLDGVAWQAGGEWGTAASPSVSLGTAGVQLADIDGDGSIDLLAKSGTTSFRYFSGAAGFGENVAIPTVPNITFEDPDVRLADMDGDRRTDVVVTSAAGLAIGYNVDGRDFTLPETVGVIDAAQELRFSDGRTQLCDVNGDRVQDLCSLRSEALVFWLGRGRGRFEEAQSATGVPEFEPTDPWRAVDLNGDGWVDLVHVGVSVVEYALAEGAGLFGEPRSISGVPEKSPSTTVEFADMNGSGTTDIVWIDVTGLPEDAWQYLELFPKGRAGLLQRIDNGLGKVATIEYEPAAKAAARARRAGEPWATRMNIGMPVVRKISVDSSLDDPLMVTEYDYQNGMWDGAERTFAGFGGGTERALGDASTPTLVTENTYEVGLVHRTLRGQPLTIEARDEQGYVFTRTTNTYSTLTLGASGVEYSYRDSETVVHVEGEDESAARTVLTEWEHDEYGNERLVAKWGEAVGTDKLAGNDETIVRRTFANDPEEWLLGYVASERTEDAAGTRVAEKRTYYDGEAFEGLALGEVTRGDVRRIESWVEDDRFADEQKNEHDEHGNVVASVDGRGGRTEIDYDEASYTLVVAERRYPYAARALSWSASYDARFGTITDIVGPNGEAAHARYDALGRLAATVKPGDTVESPSVMYSYETGAPISTVRTEVREEAGKDGRILTLSFTDGLGRKRGEFAESATEGRWILSGFLSFDARGNNSFSAYPTEEASDELPTMGDRGGTRTLFDASGRELEVRHVDSASTRTTYAPLSKTVWDENDNDPSSQHYGTPTTYTNDGLARLVRVTERARARVGADVAPREVVSGTYHYDALGNLVALADAAGHERTYTLDGRSRLRTIDDPNAGRWHRDYTDGDDLEQQTDPDGHVVRYQYDPLGRTVNEFHQLAGAAEELVTSFHYDEPADEHSDYGNVAGKLAWVEDAAGEVYFSYTQRGLLDSKTRRWTDGTEHTSWSEYDDANRPIRRGYPDGSYLALKYDARGLLDSAGPIVGGIEWTPSGELASATFGNGVVDTRAYDERLRLRRITATGPDRTAVRDLQFSLDAASRITAVDDLRDGVAKEVSLSATYQFDDRNRLVGTKDSVASTAWTYDDVHNLLSVASGHETPSLNVANEFGEGGAGPDQMTHHGSEALTYDRAGRLVEDGERKLSWDAKGRLARVERGGAIEEYVYDYLDRRAVKTVTDGGRTDRTRYIDKDVEERDGRVVRYVFVGEERVARLDPLSRETSRTSMASLHRPRTAPLSTRLGALFAGIAFGIVLLFGRSLGKARTSALSVTTVSLVAMLFGACTGNTRQHAARGAPIDEVPHGAVFYVSDQQQSPLALTNAAGVLVETTAYHPYGGVRRTSGATRDPHSFAGNEHDGGSGLGDFKARPYRPDAGIFLAPDPVAVFEAAKVLTQPERLAPYLYASGDPINRVDRDGRYFMMGVARGFVPFASLLPAPSGMTPSQQAQLGAGEVIGGALAIIAGDIEAGTGIIVAAPSGGSSLALAAVGVGQMAGGAVGVAKGLGNLAMATARAASAGSGSGAAGPPAPAKPSINAQKQAGHVQGTPQYVNRVKQGKSTSTFLDAKQGAAATQEAWEKGAPLGTDGSLRLYNFERPIGIGPEGGGFQTQVRVSMDASGQIHGTPWGPVFQGPVQP